ncbi:hypothetical protein HYS90_00305 [Candidatus Curtissbacteria bacterium]|nr:hypothetical protein [Candidatus Curtissbacteria bacterium]
MFDSLMENMIGWGKSSQIEEETYDSLTVFKHPIDADPNDELGLCGDEIYGSVGGRVVFCRDRRKAKRNSELVFQMVDWVLSAEGPIQYIGYQNDWDGKRELNLGFGENQIVLGRGGTYSIKDGRFLGSYSHWSKLLLAKPFTSPKLDIVENQNENSVHLEGRHDEELLEEIILPTRIDIQKWLPIFFDDSDKIVKDPSLPWRSWFRELGIEYRSYIEKSADSQQT